MNFLDKKVEEILKNHSSGEDFFNHLDDVDTRVLLMLPGISWFNGVMMSICG